jgi:hypothetical protein
MDSMSQLCAFLDDLAVAETVERHALRDDGLAGGRNVSEVPELSCSQRVPHRNAVAVGHDLVNGPDEVWECHAVGCDDGQI